MKNRHHIKPLDILLFAASLIAVLFSLIALKKNTSGTPLLIIDSPDGQYVYPLNKNEELNIEGKLGISIISISGGKAKFIDSPCPNKTCVQCAPISRDGEWSACMPNQIFIHVENKQKTNTVDISAS
jgi:hypothetical protein